MAEVASGPRAEIRDLEIRVRLLGAWHDGHIDLTYTKVHSCLFDTPRRLEYPMYPNKWHEDWRIDKVRLSDPGHVVHEVMFSRGSSWLIESEDLVSGGGRLGNNSQLLDGLLRRDLDRLVFALIERLVADEVAYEVWGVDAKSYYV